MNESINRKGTLFDSIISRFKNNPVVASVLVLGAVIVALASFTGAVKTLVDVSSKVSPEEARLELARLPLEYTADVFVKSAEKSNFRAVKLFLAAGMNPNVKDKHDVTALMQASGNDDALMIDMLLNAEADVNVRNNRHTALVWGRSEDTWRTLLVHGTDANSVTRALVYAAAIGNVDMLRFLFENGADLNTVGESALLATARSRAYEATARRLAETGKFLLEHGVDVNAKDKDGKTALMLSAENDLATGVVESLLDKGADVNVKNHDGRTALMMATNFSFANTNTIKALLAAGASVGEKDNNGQTALDFAKHHEKNKIIKLLEHAMAGNSVAP